MIDNRSLRTRRIFTLVLLACLAVSLICVVYPMYVIRPFRAQGARELTTALTIIRFRPVITLISALAGLVAMVGYWRERPRIWRRMVVVAGAGFVCVLALLARVNVFEMMFHPLGRPSFTAAPQVKLDKDEKVIAVKIGKNARAYPIRSISYHHVVNDQVDKFAIVATY